MADTYRVKKSEFSSNDPDTYIDVDLGGVNTTASDLTFVGRTREYGEVYNENVLHLLENFASPEVADTQAQSIYHAVPEYLINPINGQTWFNSTRKINYVYFRGRWLPNAYVGNVASNWGTVMNGVALPRPTGADGYVFPYSECAWIVAPTLVPELARGMTCSVNPATGIVTANFTNAAGTATPMEVFYQIIGIRANDYLGGADATSFRVVLNRYLIQQTVPPINSFPRLFDSTTTVQATGTGNPGSTTLRYTWVRVSPSTTQGFPPGYTIEPTAPSSATTAFRITVNSPGVFDSTQKITRGATFVCRVEAVNGSNVVVSTKLSLPIRVEFQNF